MSKRKIIWAELVVMLESPQEAISNCPFSVKSPEAVEGGKVAPCREAKVAEERGRVLKCADKELDEDLELKCAICAYDFTLLHDFSKYVCVCAFLLRCVRERVFYM